MPRERVGSIKQVGDKEFLVRVTYTNHNSKRKDVKRKAASQGRARKILKELMEEIDKGVDVTEKMTVAQLFKQWMKIKRSNLRPATFSSYGELIERYIVPDIGSIKVSRLQPLTIQSLYSKLEEGRGLSAKSIRYVHGVLNGALKQAVKWKLISYNPALAVELPRQQKKEMRSLSKEGAAKFIKALEGHRDEALFLVALTTGMRPEEYLALRWSDVDLQKGVVTVRRTLCWNWRNGGYYFGEPKTSSGSRNVSLPRSVMVKLVEHKKKQGEQRLKAGPEWQDLGLVFPTSLGSPYRSSTILKRSFRPLLKEAELDETLRLYDLRHSCATLLLEANENPKVVSERLGHARIAITLDTYSHVLPSMQQRATDKLESLLFSGNQNSESQARELSS